MAGLLRHFIAFTLFIPLFLAGGNTLFSQGNSNTKTFILMKPTGQSYRGLPLLQEVAEDDPQQQTMNELLRHSFIREMLDLNDRVQDYLESNGLITHKEPLYLLASGRMGGFPMHGFWLKRQGKIYDKRDVYYVDLATVEKNYKEPGSITQIYPHELAHCYFSLLMATDTEKRESYSSDIHYFSMTTNYFTAFNEGFAESFENISRLHEKEPSIILGIQSGLHRNKQTIDQRCNGFDRDFRWPARLGLYRMTMLFWYQRLEDYKRFSWGMNSLGRYKAMPFSSPNIEKVLLYRNSCILADEHSSRNAAVCSSTEGVINSFFTLLMESRAKFYYPAGYDRAMNPVENQLMKEFAVIHESFGTIPPGRSLLQAFVSGYIRKYPGEKDLVFKVYRETTGLAFSDKPIPEIWILNREHRHNILVMAQFGGCVAPFYTFNLNTADAPDLLTFPGISATEADSFLKWRESLGFFSGIGDLDNAPASQQKVARMLRHAKLDPVEFRKMEAGEGLSISGFLIATVLHLLKVSGIVFVVLTVIQWFIFYRGKRGMGVIIRLVLKNLFKVLLFMCIATAAFLLHYPPLIVFSAFVIIIVAVNFLTSRKDILKRREILFSSLFLFLVTGYSLV